MFRSDHRGPRLSWRELCSLVEHLPAESAIKTWIRNETVDDPDADNGPAPAPERAQMSQTELILFALRDDVRNFHHSYGQAHAKQKLGEYQPLPRPGVPVTKARRRPASAEQIASLEHIGIIPPADEKHRALWQELGVTEPA